MTKPLIRRTFIAGLVAVTLAMPAFATGISEQIVDQLRGQGYAEFSVGTTLLGRIRIVATNADFRREIILDRRTGEILRDLTTTLSGEPVATQISGSGSGTSGSGGSNSGPGGGGNSGSGSGGNSGSGSGGNSGSGGGGDDGGDDDDDDHEDDDDDDDDNSGSGGGDGGEDDDEGED